MTFSEKMNEYIELIGCSAKELSDASLISPAVISRYRNGERIFLCDFLFCSDEFTY